jgi:hypothetical protein
VADNAGDIIFELPAMLAIKKAITEETKYILRDFTILFICKYPNDCKLPMSGDPQASPHLPFYECNKRLSEKANILI